MKDLSKDIDSLSNFKLHTTEFIEQLKKTGRPVFLTVNGKEEIDLQDAQSHRETLAAFNFTLAVKSLRNSSKDIQEGRTQSIESAFQELLEKHDISR